MSVNININVYQHVVTLTHFRVERERERALYISFCSLGHNHWFTKWFLREFWGVNMQNSLKERSHSHDSRKGGHLILILMMFSISFKKKKKKQANDHKRNASTSACFLPRVVFTWNLNRPRTSLASPFASSSPCLSSKLPAGSTSPNAPSRRRWAPTS